MKTPPLEEIQRLTKGLHERNTGLQMGYKNQTKKAKPPINTEIFEVF
nr:hypothetical protein [uncultured Psychroserpens sp.]